MSETETVSGLEPIEIAEVAPFDTFPMLTTWASKIYKQKVDAQITEGEYLSHLVAYHKVEQEHYAASMRAMFRKFLKNKIDAGFYSLLKQHPTEYKKLAYWSQYISRKAAQKLATEFLPTEDAENVDKDQAHSAVLTFFLAQIGPESEPTPETEPEAAPEAVEVAPEATPEPESKPTLPTSNKKLSDIKKLTRAILIQMSQKALGAKNSNLSKGALLELIQADAPLVIRHTGNKAQNEKPVFSDWSWVEQTDDVPAHILVHYTYIGQETPDNIIFRKWEPKLDSAGQPLPHKCPKCGISAQSSSEEHLIALFGKLRIVKSKTKKGIVHRERPQSHCKGCRAAHAKNKAPALAEHLKVEAATAEAVSQD
jgi:hypothetical protein